MVKNDINDQIPLFELPTTKNSPAPKPAIPAETIEHAEENTASVAKSVLKKPSSKPAARAAAKHEVRSTLKKRPGAKSAPGPVPEGDVRLTANIREDLHLKLKIVAATRRTTIGELIEELVEQYL